MALKQMAGYCKAMVFYPDAFSSHQCTNKAKRDGYCGIHHHYAVKRRNEMATFQANCIRTKMAFDLLRKCEAIEKDPLHKHHGAVMEILAGIRG